MRDREMLLDTGSRRIVLESMARGTVSWLCRKTIRYLTATGFIIQASQNLQHREKI